MRIFILEIKLLIYINNNILRKYNVTIKYLINFNLNIH